MPSPASVNALAAGAGGCQMAWRSCCQRAGVGNGFGVGMGPRHCLPHAVFVGSKPNLPLPSDLPPLPPLDGALCCFCAGKSVRGQLTTPWVVSQAPTAVVHQLGVLRARTANHSTALSAIEVLAQAFSGPVAPERVALDVVLPLMPVALDRTVELLSDALLRSVVARHHLSRRCGRPGPAQEH